MHFYFGEKDPIKVPILTLPKVQVKFGKFLMSLSHLSFFMSLSHLSFFMSFSSCHFSSFKMLELTFSSKLDWGALTLSLLLKLPPRKFES